MEKCVKQRRSLNLSFEWSFFENLNSLSWNNILFIDIFNLNKKKFKVTRVYSNWNADVNLTCFSEKV